MAAVSESETKVLDPHIPSGERLIEAYCGEEETIAVTDRRVINLRHRDGDRKQETELDSTLLTTDYIVGTEYEQEKETIPPEVERAIAVIVGIVGVVGIAFGITGATIGIVLGLVLLPLSALLWYFTEAEESGEVSVTLHRAGDLPDKTWSLPKGETDVPQAISEQVATLHRPM